MADVSLITITPALASEFSDPQAFEQDRGLSLGGEANALNTVVQQTEALRAKNGAPPEWGGFLVVDSTTKTVVGTCGFKGAPDPWAKRVEIVCFTLSPYEGRGYATAMAGALVEHAAVSGQVRFVRAHTLPQEGASTKILKKLGFTNRKTVQDPKNGTVWRWSRPVWRQSWALQKSELALRLARGECGASYGESMLIICSVLSAMAAEVWPGRRIDQCRFVELLVSFSNEPDVFRKISIPLLAKNLHDGQDANGANTLHKAFLPSSGSLVVTIEVDRTEMDVQNVLPALDRKKIRRFSYANLLYEQVRSSYVHEYKAGDNADSSPMTEDETVPVSYGNWMKKDGKGTERHIFFHSDWLAKQLSVFGARADAESHGFPFKPGAWWLDG